MNRSCAANRQGGFTLIEMMVALAVVILLIGAVAMSFGSVRKARLRKAAVQLSSSIRFGYDRALATGRDFRLVMQLGGDRTTYWLEIAEKGAVRVGKSVDKSREMRERALEEEEEQAESDGTTAGGLDEALTLKRSPKPKWSRYKSRLAAKITMKGARVTGVPGTPGRGGDRRRGLPLFLGVRADGKGGLLHRGQ